MRLLHAASVLSIILGGLLGSGCDSAGESLPEETGAVTFSFAAGIDANLTSANEWEDVVVEAPAECVIETSEGGLLAVMGGTFELEETSFALGLAARAEDGAETTRTVTGTVERHGDVLELTPDGEDRPLFATLTFPTNGTLLNLADPLYVLVGWGVRARGAQRICPVLRFETDDVLTSQNEPTDLVAGVADYYDNYFEPPADYEGPFGGGLPYDIGLSSDMYMSIDSVEVELDLDGTYTVRADFHNHRPRNSSVFCSATAVGEGTYIGDDMLQALDPTTARVAFVRAGDRLAAFGVSRLPITERNSDGCSFYWPQAFRRLSLDPTGG